MAADEETKPPSFPQYTELIIDAITALDDKNGSNKSAISKYIESQHEDLPAGHSTLLSHHLNRMRDSGELVMVKNNYLRPSPDAPPKRGRGRPPKPKMPLPPGTVVASPRSRGRPPKPKDPLAAAAGKVVGGSPKPRGRPPKKARLATDAPAQAGSPTPATAPGGVKRSRGRPPKVKTPIAAVECE